MANFADLWGLNPATGQLYSVQERRDAMAARGSPARSPFGPLPSAMWDEFFNRVNTAQSGLPQEITNQPGGIFAFTGGKYTPQVAELNEDIINQASRRPSFGFALDGLREAAPHQPFQNPRTDTQRELETGLGSVQAQQRRNRQALAGLTGSRF